jgi:copper transport protein
MQSRRRAALIVMLAILWSLVPRAALAHAILVRTDPPNACALPSLARLPATDPRCAAGVVLQGHPDSVHLWFSERVKPFAGGIKVKGPSGRAVEQGQVRVAGEELSVAVDSSEEGTYLVRWQVISDDTHPVRGSFAFSVGVASLPPAGAGAAGNEIGAVSALGLVLQVIARWLHFVGFCLGFGVLATLLLVLHPLSLSAEPSLRARLLRLVNAGVLLLLGGAGLALVAQTASFAPSDALNLDAMADVLASTFGRALALQAGAALFLWTLLGIMQRGSARATLPALGTGLALAFVDGSTAHAAGRGLSWIGLSLNMLHMAAMGVWFGGLTALLAVRRLPAFRSRSGEILHRFRRLAIASLALLAGSGAAMAIGLIGRAANLLGSAYGRTLVLKVALTVAVLALAWGAAMARERRRWRWWAVEATALAGVLALAGLLVSLPPPR